MELHQLFEKNQKENFLYISELSFYESKKSKPYMLCLSWNNLTVDRCQSIVQYHIGGKWVSLQLSISSLEIIDTVQSLRWSSKKGTYLILNLNDMNVETIKVTGEPCRVRSWLYRCSRKNYKRYVVKQEG